LSPALLAACPPWRRRVLVLSQLLSFPTRRSSDLAQREVEPLLEVGAHGGGGSAAAIGRVAERADEQRDVILLGIANLEHDFDERDRKSTRLNSSHQIISYAVFCLKKKKEHQLIPR